MGKLVLVAAVVFVVVIPLATVLLRRRPLAAATPVDQNHLAMARWIDRQLRDDMVRVTLSSDDRDIGSALLEEFYGEGGGPRQELT